MYADRVKHGNCIMLYQNDASIFQKNYDAVAVLHVVVII